MRRLASLVLAVVPVALACASLEAAQLFHSGTRALDAGDAARAVADLERAAALAPQDSAIQNHLGLAYEEAGRPAAALVALERAVALDCGNEAAAQNLRALRARHVQEAP